MVENKKWWIAQYRSSQEQSCSLGNGKGLATVNQDGVCPLVKLGHPVREADLPQHSFDLRWIAVRGAIPDRAEQGPPRQHHPSCGVPDQPTEIFRPSDGEVRAAHHNLSPAPLPQPDEPFEHLGGQAVVSGVNQDALARTRVQLRHRRAVTELETGSPYCAANAIG